MISEQLSRTLGENNHIWFGYSLQPCREIRCFADDAAFLRFARTYEVADNDESGCNTDARLQRDWCVERDHGRDQFKCCTYCPVCIVLMRFGIA
jgi:hypothetical protein